MKIERPPMKQPHMQIVFFGYISLLIFFFCFVFNCWLTWLCLLIHSKVQWELELLEWKWRLMDMGRMWQTAQLLRRRMQCDVLPAKEVSCSVPTVENFSLMICLKITWETVQEMISNEFSLHKEDECTIWNVFDRNGMLARLKKLLWACGWPTGCLKPHTDCCGFGEILVIILLVWCNSNTKMVQPHKERVKRETGVLWYPMLTEGIQNNAKCKGTMLWKSSYERVCCLMLALLLLLANSSPCFQARLKRGRHFWLEGVLWGAVLCSMIGTVEAIFASDSQCMELWYLHKCFWSVKDAKCLEKKSSKVCKDYI